MRNLEKIIKHGDYTSLAEPYCSKLLISRNVINLFPHHILVMFVNILYRLQGKEGGLE